jgi:hypothetical protein
MLFYDGECTPGTLSGVNAQIKSSATNKCGPADHFCTF